MPAPPVNLILACVFALLPLPALMLLDMASGGCGDGLCGFLPGLILMSLLAGGTIIMAFRSARRQETRGLALAIPFLLWLAALVPLLA